jgi:hypothetical protein
MTQSPLPLSHPHLHHPHARSLASTSLYQLRLDESFNVEANQLYNRVTKLLKKYAQNDDAAFALFSLSFFLFFLLRVLTTRIFKIHGATHYKVKYFDRVCEDIWYDSFPLMYSIPSHFAGVTIPTRL